VSDEHSLIEAKRQLLTPRRVVIGATAHAELSRALIAARASLEVRGNRYTELTAADLEWGDTYLGFRRPPLESMGNIRWVHCTGAGVDSWLHPTELPRDILLTRTAESFGVMIAEWALARALAFSQELEDLAARQRERQWAPRDVRMIRGTTAVIVGTGDVGTHIAKLFSALGCRAVGVSRSGHANPTVFAEAHPVAALRDVVGQADWLILALPHTVETRALISRDVLSLCRGAVLINAGRGIVVEESALPDALDRGWLRGAALDVFEIEPLPPTSPLWTDPRVIISPHCSGPTTIDGAVSGFLECLADVERGVTPARVVDRQKQY
jgi:glyoxylate/hydroxypyruvate reductase